MTADKPTFQASISIPVNPNYKWGDSAIQAEYVNPVELNNRTILLANMYSHASEKLVQTLKHLGDIKKSKLEADRNLREFERELLRTNPPSAGDRQSTALLNAYLSRLIHEDDGLLAAYHGLQDAVHKADVAQIDAQTQVDVWRTRLSNIETVGTDIQTHLSFVKAEQRHSRSYT